MHHALVIAAAAGMVAFAWFTDRLLLDAYIQYGTYAGSEGTGEILLLADRVPRLVLLLLLGVLLLGARWERVGRPVATILFLAGGLLALVPLVGIGLRVEWALPLPGICSSRCTSCRGRRPA